MALAAARSRGAPAPHRRRAVWWSAYRTPGDGDGERCHLNASAAYCLRNAYGCRYCDPFLEAADIQPALGDGDAVDDADAIAYYCTVLDAAADQCGPPVDCIARAKAKREGLK